MAAPLAKDCVKKPADNRWLNRRVAVRHPCGPVTRGRVTEAVSFRFRRARIQDISTGGIALLTRQTLPAGAHVWIQLRNEILGITYDLAARVVHARREVRNSWVIGCQFARTLSEPELETLLF